MRKLKIAILLIATMTMTMPVGTVAMTAPTTVMVATTAATTLIQDCPSGEIDCLPPEERPEDCVPQDEQIIITWVGIIPIITIVPAITC